MGWRLIRFIATESFFQVTTTKIPKTEGDKVKSGPIPSEATFSRFINALAENEELYQLFLKVVQKGREMGIIGCENLVVDSTDINAYEKKRPKKVLAQDGTKADWGSKKDSNGNQLTWFGYKLHLAVDPKSECPVDLKLTPASVSDGEPENFQSQMDF